MCVGRVYFGSETRKHQERLALRNLGYARQTLNNYEEYEGIVSMKLAIKMRKRWVRHEDFPEGHPFQYYSRPQAFSFGGLMGSGAIA